jgi:hypothetical protein
MQAVDLFEQRVPAGQVAWRLRVSAKSAYQWQRTWRPDGRGGLLSKGPSGSRCRLRGGSAVDAAADHGADRSAVSRPVHRAWRVVSVAPYRLDPAGAGASCRRTGSAGNRRLA